MRGGQFWYNKPSQAAAGKAGEERMIRIEGKAASAVCFAEEPDATARADIVRLCNLELMRGRKIRIMPDVHANGDGSVTGFTMTLGEPVMLALEYGSGCGVLAARLDTEQVDLKKLDEICHQLPDGGGKRPEKPAYAYDFSPLRCFGATREAYARPVSLGCLGGGNHFIEVDRDEAGGLYLIVHNGLGGLARPVLRYYRLLALRRSGNALTADGRPSRPVRFSDLCLYGQEMADYLHDMKIMEDVCRVNRRWLADFITDRLGLTVSEYTDICHHYTDEEEGIVRHGAIAARAGQRVLIPVSAGEGCILGTGKGNPDWNFSAPHGAGRLLSRSAARQAISLEAYRESMKNVYSTTVCEENLDEAPAAYKPMAGIAAAIQDSVRIDQILRPVYNYKN